MIDDAVIYLARALCGEFYRGHISPLDPDYEFLHKKYVEAGWFSWVPQASAILKKIAIAD